MAAWRPLVILPTYDEAGSVPDLTALLLEVAPEAETLVVDDASPDGTGRWVARRAAELAAEGRPRLHLLARPRRLGLGTAYRDGWEWALERGYDPVVTMDADLSHDPSRLPALLALLEQGADVAIGSRYVPGGGVRDWSLWRRLLSRAANTAARALLGLPVRDATSGFRAYRARVLRAIEPGSIRAEGYSFLEETLWRIVRGGFRCAETPILFRGRRRDRSKISRAEILRGAATLLRLAVSRRPRLRPAPEHAPTGG